MEHFHKILKAHFRDKNLSEVARNLAIPRSVLSDWLKEEKDPSFKNLDYLKRIADHLGLSLDELLLGETTARVISNITFEDGTNKYQVLINKIK
jgi:DNA-binding phage protein